MRAHGGGSSGAPKSRPRGGDRGHMEEENPEGAAGESRGDPVAASRSKHWVAAPVPAPPAPAPAPAPAPVSALRRRAVRDASESVAPRSASTSRLSRAAAPGSPAAKGVLEKESARASLT